MATALDHAQLGDQKAIVVVFKALGNESRLRVLELLASGPLTIPQLRANPTIPASVEQHIRTLEGAGLVEQLPGVIPRSWRVVPGALDRAALVISGLAVV
ncbi:ArsR family transcriptional regulator [Branchiibius cervicis]|uniref:ArsR family transcriptional regulator n=1 Tax=Branchiibius cervicis TaxID=908252 RepID=A0ABW2AUC1_9MICO